MEKPAELFIKLDEFEGPLDLLLHLIKETKMDIQEVPMLTIVDQYLTFIHSMQTMQLDVAGEYLVMAATLLEIKSRMLLPRVDIVEIDEVNYEQDEYLQEELIRQLIEYKQFKDVATVLKEKENQRGQYFTKEPSHLESLQEHIPLKEGEISFEDVLKAFKKMFQKQMAKKMVQTKIDLGHISVEETMMDIVSRVKKVGSGLDLREFATSKSTLIVTFLAMLELAKAKKIRFEQGALHDTIYLFAGENIDKQLDNLTISGLV